MYRLTESGSRMYNLYRKGGHDSYSLKLMGVGPRSLTPEEVDVLLHIGDMQDSGESTLVGLADMMYMEKSDVRRALRTLSEDDLIEGISGRGLN